MNQSSQKIISKFGTENHFRDSVDYTPRENTMKLLAFIENLEIGERMTVSYFKTLYELCLHTL